MDNYLAAVITAVIRMIFSLVACILLLKMGRRSLGILSAVGTSLASFILAGYISAVQNGSTVDVSIVILRLLSNSRRSVAMYTNKYERLQPYILAVCLLFYVGANTVGLLTLPGLMTGELMPQRARGIGGGCIFFGFNLLMFFVTKYFPQVVYKYLIIVRYRRIQMSIRHIQYYKRSHFSCRFASEKHVSSRERERAYI